MKSKKKRPHGQVLSNKRWCDSNNMLVPIDSTRLGLYTTTRKNPGSPAFRNWGTPARAGHIRPSLRHSSEHAGTAASFQQQAADSCSQCRTLVRPVTRAQFLDAALRSAANLFSHSDQEAQWESSVAQGQATSGWGGRLADQMASYLRVRAVVR